MLLEFFYTLRALKVPVSPQEWLYLMEALVSDLAESSLQRFYFLARAILVKSESLYDSYDQAFVLCFREGKGDFQVKQELLDWLNKVYDEKGRPRMPDVPKLDLDELRKKLLERLQEQTEEHHGGNYWIGTKGTSPFGHSGSHPSGIRIGGESGGRSAMQVAEERRFKNYRNDVILDTRQFKVALKRLRRLDRIGVQEELDLDQSIDATCKNAGEIELIFEPPQKNQVELILLMDVGGSMDPYIHLMEAIFSAAHASAHFKAFKHYYFHNCIYSKLFEDMERHSPINTEELFHRYGKTFEVIIIGDACMNPFELFSPGGAIDYWEQNRTTGLNWLKKIKAHYPQTVWINPEPDTIWNHVTIHSIRQIIKMYPLTVQGLTNAVDDLRREDVKPENRNRIGVVET